MKGVKLSRCPICLSTNIVFQNKFFVCTDCNYQTAGIKNQSELDSYYNKDDVGLKVQNILETSHNSPLRIYHKKAINCIISKRRIKRICDIGCGVGVFLKKLQNDKYTVYGYDINETQTKIANKKYGLKNVGYAYSLSEYCKKKRIERNFFDVITSFEVMEHVTDVNAFIEESRMYLKKGGLLIISTPNSRRIPLHESWDYPPIHLSRFSKKNIELLLKNHSLKLLTWTTYNELGYYSNNFIHKLSVSQRMLKNMVNSDANSRALQRNLNMIVVIKKLICKIIDVPLYLGLLSLKGNGHTMFFVAKKI